MRSSGGALATTCAPTLHSALSTEPLSGPDCALEPCVPLALLAQLEIISLSKFLSMPVSQLVLVVNKFKPHKGIKGVPCPFSRISWPN